MNRKPSRTSAFDLSPPPRRDFLLIALCVCYVCDLLVFAGAEFLWTVTLLGLIWQPLLITSWCLFGKGAWELRFLVGVVTLSVTWVYKVIRLDFGPDVSAYCVALAAYTLPVFGGVISYWLARFLLRSDRSQRLESARFGLKQMLLVVTACAVACGIIKQTFPADKLSTMNQPMFGWWSTEEWFAFSSHWIAAIAATTTMSAWYLGVTSVKAVLPKITYGCSGVLVAAGMVGAIYIGSLIWVSLIVMVLVLGIVVIPMLGLCNVSGYRLPSLSEMNSAAECE